MKEILLTKGLVALVDDEDYERVNAFKWNATANGYSERIVARRQVHIKGKKHNVYMHRFIMNAPSGMCVDHINHEPLDNRKSNLRICTKTQNCHNMIKRTRRCSSTYKGVSYAKDASKWRAFIRVDTRLKHIGYYQDEKSAALAYNTAARNYFGEYALLNKILV